jgi:hypothetical protein
MAKAKSKAIISVPDGAGGMVKVEDRRFETGDWPIAFEVPNQREQADRWLRYVRAECRRRGWSDAGLGQLERAENSGTITIIATGKPLLTIVWERKRGYGPIKVRARVLSSELSLPDAKVFFDQINDACRSGLTEPIYVRGTLQYVGMAWRGELWLDDAVRLGPPSLQDGSGTNMLGAGVVHVDAMLDCIGNSDVSFARHQMLVEMSAFLSVVLGKHVRLPDTGQTWTWKDGTPRCEVRSLGYMEAANPPTMPVRGTDPPVPLYPIDSPPRGVDVTTTEISARADITDLWRTYRSLTADQRRQFLQAAAKWQEAMMHWQERRSLSFALMVVACEALKPTGAYEYNCYEVIEALLGKSTRDQLRQHAFPAQRVRNSHLHAGELHGSELMRMAFLSSYQDPSFGEAHRELFKVTQAAIIEWLRRGGTFAMPPIKARKTRKRSGQGRR